MKFDTVIKRLVNLIELDMEKFVYYSLRNDKTLASRIEYSMDRKITAWKTIIKEEIKRDYVWHDILDRFNFSYR